MVAGGALIPVTISSWATAMVPIDKGQGRYRVCGDCKQSVNLGIVMEYYAFSTLPDLFKAAGKHFFFFFFFFLKKLIFFFNHPNLKN